MIRHLGFLALVLVAITVDPVRLPPFVWLVLAILAGAWCIVFKPLSRKDW